MQRAGPNACCSSLARYEHIPSHTPSTPHTTNTHTRIITQDNTPVASDALDILSEAAAAFGPQLQPLHARLVAAMLARIDDGRPALRKRALACLGAPQLCSLGHLLSSTALFVLP